MPPGMVTVFLFAPFLRLRAGRSHLLTHPAQLPDLRSFKKTPCPSSIGLVGKMGFEVHVCTGGLLPWDELLS